MYMEIIFFVAAASVSTPFIIEFVLNYCLRGVFEKFIEWANGENRLALRTEDGKGMFSMCLIILCGI